jgi:hypothetical protein
MESAQQGSNLLIFYLEDSEDFMLHKVSFPRLPFGRSARVQTLKPKDLVFLDGPNATPNDEVSSSRSGIRPDGSTHTELKEFPSARCSNAYAIGADGGTSQSNRPIASLLHPDVHFTKSTCVLQILRS